LRVVAAMHQFCIEDECWAPRNTFDQIAWQQDSIVLDACIGDVNWYAWQDMTGCLTTLELEMFAAQLGGEGLCAARDQRIPFLVRDKQKIARSRRAFLNDISYRSELQAWQFEVTFAE
jgi:hypothetical protein